MENEKKYWLDQPHNVDKIFWGLVGICALLAVFDVFYPKHVDFFWEDWIAFYGVYGFVSCVGLVLLAKQMRKLVKRDPDYYER
ncbi:MAG: hypothetical protein HYV04_02815 [Deltaproteobacteria bacterium]|nr:hypothetical protein [Deltaproteobacteria bacterium]